MQAAPADDVGHERVAGREPAARERKRERPHVDAIARPAVPLENDALQEYGQTTLELPLASAGPVGQLEPSRELAQELEQRQVGPGGRLDPVGRATAALSAGSSSRKPGFRLTLPLR